MNSEEIALQVERDIKALARKWKKSHPGSRRKPMAVATATSALYLRRHQNLYRRATIEETRTAHQYWMDLMKEWFLSIIEKGKNSTAGEQQ